ncbi:MAG: choice-of-anchor D domain-containing protein [Nitrospirota bacterium]
METKGILRMVLVIVSSVMMLGSICDNGNKGGGNPLEPDPYAGISVHSTTQTGITFNEVLDFGDVLVGTEVSHQFSISNKGWGGVDLKYILWLDATSPSAAPFSLSALLYNTKPCSSTTIVSASLSPSTLKSGEICYFYVVYKPKYEGTHMAKIVIQSNDLNHQEEWIWVKGYGYYEKGEPIEDVPWSDPGSGKKRSGKLR